MSPLSYNVDLLERRKSHKDHKGTKITKRKEEEGSGE
jgi:hypothetical protein